MKTNLKRWLSLFMVLALVFSLTGLVYAEDITPGQEQTSAGYTYTAPTAPMAVDDSIITASAHHHEHQRQEDTGENPQEIAHHVAGR